MTAWTLLGSEAHGWSMYRVVMRARMRSGHRNLCDGAAANSRLRTRLPCCTALINVP